MRHFPPINCQQSSRSGVGSDSPRSNTLSPPPATISAVSVQPHVARRRCSPTRSAAARHLLETQRSVSWSARGTRQAMSCIYIERKESPLRRRFAFSALVTRPAASWVPRVLLLGWHSMPQAWKRCRGGVSGRVCWLLVCWNMSLFIRRFSPRAIYEARRVRDAALLQAKAAEPRAPAARPYLHGRETHP